jgi:hypothetical protein
LTVKEGVAGLSANGYHDFMVHVPELTSFRSITLDPAEALMDELVSHRGARWEGLSAHDWNWIYRGQANSAWKLTPSSMRPGVLSQFLTLCDPPMVDRPIRSAQEQRDLEEHVVVDFASGVDHQGLAIPGDHQRLRDKTLAHLSNDATDFPQVDRLGIYALAQHHGIPTRLLDWSRDPRIAAYFAAVEVARIDRDKKERPDSFSVWALSRRYVDEVAQARDPFISLVTAPTTTNPNLHLQRALFTLVGYRRNPDPEPIIIPTVDEILLTPGEAPPNCTEIWWNHLHRVPPLWKYTVPASQAGVLLRFLAIDGICAETIFHGHDGVVRGMRERCLRQQAPLHDRR